MVKRFLIGFVIGIITIFLLWESLPFQKYLKFILYYEDRKNVIEMVQSGEIVGDPFTGVAILQEALKKTSRDGEINIFNSNEVCDFEHGTVIGFTIETNLKYRIAIVYDSTDSVQHILMHIPTTQAITRLKQYWYYCVIK